MIMITWILLVSLFCKSTQDRNGKENAVLRCGPQNMTLTTPDKKILLTWEDEAACLAVRDALTYELAVLIADEQVHDDIVAVTPDQVGSTHSWSWTPDLALECASHSVRLRARYKNYTSPWRQEQTAPGIENKSKQPEIFPQDRVVKVGSRATFCCVLPEGHIFEQMYVTSYSGSEWNTTKITNQTYAMTVDLHQPSNTYGSGTDVLCRTQINDNGASVFIGYPPDDRDLQCETRDLQSVECTWAVGNNTHLGSKHQTVYRLLGSPCANPGSCFRKAQVSVGEQNWTLTAQNPLGTVELTHRADLMKRVHMIAPEGLSASDVNARNVTLKWRLTVPQYNNLDITCQVNNSGITTASETFGVGLTSTVLDDLIPDSTYTVMVRCGTTRHLWKWSEWSSSIKFQTKGDVPDALDVWMQAKDNETMIIWKVLLANQSHGHILDHEVTWAPTNTPERKNRSKVAHNKNGLVLSLDATREYIISVTARNINGSSSPSTITIPSSSPANRVDPSRILGTDGGLNLSWSASPIASCGYIVDWCPTSVESTVDWLKVPPGETNASIFRNFKDGLRYLLSVYACTQGAPMLLERREGYVREKKIQDDLFGTLKWKQQDSDVEVSWDSLPPRAQTAFITGYILYCLDNNNNNVYSVSTDNPEATKLTARNLKIGTYTFKVMAKTAVGECGTTIIRATLNSPSTLLLFPFRPTRVEICVHK
ncbi:hypothetical protein PAMA_008145 [Pampus argenteus]